MSDIVWQSFLCCVISRPKNDNKCSEFINNRQYVLTVKPLSFKPPTVVLPNYKYDIHSYQLSTVTAFQRKRQAGKVHRLSVGWVWCGLTLSSPVQSYSAGRPARRLHYVHTPYRWHSIDTSKYTSTLSLFSPFGSLGPRGWHLHRTTCPIIRATWLFYVCCSAGV